MMTAMRESGGTTLDMGTDISSALPHKARTRASGSRAGNTAEVRTQLDIKLHSKYGVGHRYSALRFRRQDHRQVESGSA
jgi:hypothetical protein